MAEILKPEEVINALTDGFEVLLIRKTIHVVRGGISCVSLLKIPLEDVFVYVKEGKTDEGYIFVKIPNGQPPEIEETK